MQTPEKPKRSFNESTAVMLIAASTIAESALANQPPLQEADTTYTADNLKALHDNIDAAIRDILGADNAAALRADTDTLEAAHADAHHQLDLTKLLIENKYAADHARRDELLNTLGFRAHYADAAKSQAAMGQLLSRFSENLTPALEATLIGNGLPPARIAALRAYAHTYTPLNVTQEGQKGTRSTLTDDDVRTLNHIYSEVISICRMAQRIFKTDPATRDRFVYDKVAARQSSYHTGTAAVTPVPSPSA